MGMFSSKKKTKVSTAVTRVVEDNQLPDLTRTALIRSILQNRRYTQVHLEEVLNSKTMKFERAYRYAKNGGYYYGTPNHTIRNATDGQDVTRNLIEAELGTAIQFDYFYFAPPNNLHYGWQRLTEDYDYDEFSNEVRALSTPGNKVYVDRLVGQVNTYVEPSDDPEEPDPVFQMPDEGTLETWERHPQDRYAPHRTHPKQSPWLFDESHEDGVRVHLIDQSGNRSELFFSMLEFDEDMEYFQAKYRYTQGSDQKFGYFTYRYGSGTYPVLDTIHEGEAVGQGTFMPIVFFRHNREDRTASHLRETAAYKTSERLTKMFGIDYQEMADAINENDDVDKVEQAVMMFAVPASSEDPVDQQYLYSFFDWLYLQNPSSAYGAKSRLTNAQPGKAITIADKDFNCTLSYSGITRKRVVGNITDFRKYSGGVKKVTRYLTVTEKEYNNQTGEYDVVERQIPYTVKVHKYYFQDKPGSYLEVSVDNLRLRYSIYKNKGVEAELGDEKLLIPLDYNICRSFGHHEREILYHRALHLVFNSRVTVKVKWYQRGAFKFVVSVAAAAIVFFSGGTGGPIAAALISIGVATAVAIFIEILVLQFIFEQVFKIVMDELGVEVAAVLAAVMIAMGIADFSVTSSGTPLITATSMISTGINLVSAATNQYFAERIAKYEQKTQEFALLAEEKLKELEEIEEALNPGTVIDPLEFVGRIPDVRLGESPDSLYSRTVHAGNIGTLCFDYIESFVALNTRLPDFSDLVGSTLYGFK